ncbi:hypothetical protein [Tranquillimonas alkanivorans]|uniref:Lipoprotein n=1 Tax=Tranquillimonas alkanivorans TaxID=441119 RepID=A0A1I5KCE6_9RHOB|nr:hypothetical protein [Tranquillimonas alkanivorans]SFO82266.1 hypothetical protein SAMN04488047_1012 [Tranquillimonas alkanivorans]
MIRTAARTLSAVALAALAACATPDPDAQPELGDFRLGHNVVLVDAPQKGPFSREASDAELKAALTEAVEERLARYDGDGLYHLGIAIGAYVLAQPGVPLVYTPKSVLVFEVTVFDNSTQQKLNEEPHRIYAFEGLQNMAPVVGSGIARSKEEQLDNLAAEGARLIEDWLRENEAWFEPEPGAGRTPFDREAEKAKLQALN